MQKRRNERRGRGSQQLDRRVKRVASHPGGHASESPTDSLSGRPKQQLIVRTATALLSGQVVTQVTAIVALLALTRLLGVTNLGVVAAASTVGMFVTVIAVFGTRDYLVREVARKPHETAAIVGNVVVVRLAIWLLLAVILTLGALLFLESTTRQLVLIVVLATGGTAMVGEAALGGLQANHSLGRAVMARSGVRVATQGTAIAVLVVGGGVLAYVLTLWAFTVLLVGATVLMLWTRFGGPIRWSPAASGSVLRGGRPFFALELARQVYGGAAILLLSAITTASTVGQYSLAARLVTIPIFVPTVIKASTLPSLSKWARTDRDAYRAALTKAVRVVLIATVPMAAGIMLLAGELPELIGGSEFNDSTPIILVLATTIPLISVDTMLGSGLIALDRQRAWAMVAWVAALAGPLFHITFISLADRLWDNGGIGAAVAVLSTELLMGIAAWIMLGSNIDARAVASVALRAALVSAGMGIVVYSLLDSVGPIAVVPIGAVVYAGGRSGSGSSRARTCGSSGPHSLAPPSVSQPPSCSSQEHCSQARDGDPGRGKYVRAGAHDHVTQRDASRYNGPLVTVDRPRAPRSRFNELQCPTDVVLLAVLWRLRSQLGFRDVAELLLRGCMVTHETVRGWEFRFAPLERKPRSSAPRAPRAILRAARAPSPDASKA